MHVRRARLCILVKAYPQPSQKYEETVCCAGISDAGELLRLYPVPYRRLRPEQRFDRFDVIEAEIFKASEDQRPESYKVEPESLRIIQSGHRMNSMEKVRLWSGFVAPSIEALKRENVCTGRSLGIVRPEPGSIRFYSRKVKPEDAEDQAIFRSLVSQVNLFDTAPLPELHQEFIFGYQFRTGDNQHEMKIHDWEVQAAYFNYKRRYGNNGLAELTAVYGSEMPNQNLHLVLGTMKAHPRQFIIIGLLRSPISPDVAAAQMTLI